MQKKGDKYGAHRVISPAGVLTQAAQKIDNNMEEICSNEILVRVRALNIDSASFTQIKLEAGGDDGKIRQKILGIVSERGKMQNPVTGSGGMFIGEVLKIGDGLGHIDINPGDKIASLTSLSLTPLKIDKIIAVHKDTGRVDVDAKAILFESGLYTKLPEDIDQNLALVALDVAGAPAQVAKLVKPGQSVLVLGAGGKSGMLSCYEASKRVGTTGRVVALARKSASRQAEFLLANGYCHAIVYCDATQPIEALEKTLAANNGNEYNISVNCVNVENTEMASILPVEDGGVVYFFSMATSFTRAALGAEGAGKDVTMIVGNGYTKDHAEITLNELRESAQLRRMFEELYV